ncbi:hypothetical protein ACFE04_021708 [Oxalis oulophora]
MVGAGKKVIDVAFKADKTIDWDGMAKLWSSMRLSSIAMETLHVFAPLAKLLGMYQIKSELENLSFMYTNPEDYAKVKRRASELYKEHEKELEELRIVIRPKPSTRVGLACSLHKICYHVLGLVHEIWTPIPRAARVAGTGVGAIGDAAAATTRDI